MQWQDKSQSVPDSIIPSAFTTLAWDNIDKCEETLTGDGTTHRINGIAIQRAGGDATHCQPIQTIMRTRRRSFQCGNLPLANYTAVDRVGPAQCETSVSEDSSAEATAGSLQHNVIWAIIRHQSRMNQVVPSWTGFNIRVRSNHVVEADRIAYLPPIDGPASSLTTVWEVLQRSVKIQKELSLSALVCVFYQALNTKAAEIVWSH